MTVSRRRPSWVIIIASTWIIGHADAGLTNVMERDKFALLAASTRRGGMDPEGVVDHPPLPPPPSYICLSKERDIELCAADCGDIIKSAFERRRERSTRSFRARSSMRDHRNCGRETDTSSRKLIYL